MICRVWASSGPNGSSIKQDLGIADQHLRQRDALLLAAGEHVRVAVEEGREPDPGEPPPGLLVGLGLRHALRLERDGDVVERRLPRHQRVLLEEVAGAPVEP